MKKAVKKYYKSLIAQEKYGVKKSNKKERKGDKKIDKLTDRKDYRESTPLAKTPKPQKYK